MRRIALLVGALLVLLLTVACGENPSQRDKSASAPDKSNRQEETTSLLQTGAAFEETTVDETTVKQPDIARASVAPPAFDEDLDYVGVKRADTWGPQPQNTKNGTAYWRYVDLYMLIDIDSSDTAMDTIKELNSRYADVDVAQFTVLERLPTNQRCYGEDYAVGHDTKQVRCLADGEFYSGRFVFWVVETADGQDSVEAFAGHSYPVGKILMWSAEDWPLWSN
jgi:hypothetical protein